MNLIYLAFCWGDSCAILGGILFCITHAALSTLMFFLVDCIQKRFNSRNLTEIAGLLQATPNLGIAIIIMCILYAGLPNTLKFTSEFYIFIGLLETSIIYTSLLIFIANVIGLVGFSKCWFNVVFGINFKQKTIASFDLTLKELLILSLTCVFLVICTFFTNYFF
jgi:NADH-quinone oxidoreductase subunit M